jgi:uncharacterized protein (DUF488 family)
MINVATIGFTKTSAAHFFERIKNAKVRTVIDVRLKNSSQLAGFAKSEDLEFFLRDIAGAGYVHKPILAPTDEMLKKYKKQKGSWSEYADSFLNLMAGRRIEEKLSRDVFERSCLLCSEDKPHHCHRRLVCEYLNGKWGGALKVTHL